MTDGRIGIAWKGFRTNRAGKRRQTPGRPPTAWQCRRLACRLCGTMRLVSDADRARSVLRRSPTPLSEKVASLFGSRALLCNARAGNAAPAHRNDRGLTAVSSAVIALAIDFPDISCAMSKLIVTFAIPDDQQTPLRPVRAACRNVRGLDTFWSVGL